MEKYQEELETNKELVDIIRFLIEDQAFHSEFIVTAILEYYANNKTNKGE